MDPSSDELLRTLLSNHGRVLLCISQDADMRLRDIAHEVGITERAVQRIVLELEEAGVVARTRRGRRNHYAINRTAPLRSANTGRRSVGDLIRLLQGGG